MLPVGPVGGIKGMGTRGSRGWPDMFETSGRGLLIQGPADNTWKMMMAALTEEAFGGEAIKYESRAWPLIEGVNLKHVKGM